jgi:hypothetical protein
LPELELIEGNQQVVMKRDKPLSPSTLLTFRSRFATIHRYCDYDFMTARGSRPRHVRNDIPATEDLPKSRGKPNAIGPYYRCDRDAAPAPSENLAAQPL